MDNVISGTSVVNISTTSLLGTRIIVLVILKVGLVSVEVGTGVVTINRDDVDITLGMVNKDTSSLIIDGVIIMGVSVSTKLKLGRSVKTAVVSTVVLTSEVKVATTVNDVGVSTRVVFNNGVDNIGVTMTEGIVGNIEVNANDENDMTVGSSLDTAVIVGMVIILVNTDDGLVMIRSLCVNKLNSLEDGIAINDDISVGETVSEPGIDVSISVNKRELVSKGTKDVKSGMLVDDKAGRLEVRGNVRTTDVDSSGMVVTIKDTSVVLLNENESNDVNVAEGMIVESLTSLMKKLRLDDGTDAGIVVMSTPKDVLDNSGMEVATKSEVLNKSVNEGDVINGGKLESTVTNDEITPSVVWSADNKIDVIGDGKIVTTGMVVAVKISSEENVIASVVVTDCITVVGIITVVVGIISVTPVV